MGREILKEVCMHAGMHVASYAYGNLLINYPANWLRFFKLKNFQI